MPYQYALPAEELSQNLSKRIDTWNSQITSNGLKNLWQRLYNTYFGRHWKSTVGYQDNDIVRVGQNGELSGLTVNDFRNIIKHMLVLTTSQKISFEPQGTNTDEKSLVQTRLAKIIMDYYVREKKVDRFLHDQAEMALVLGKSFIKCTWDKQLGRPYSTIQDEQGVERIVYEGDIKLQIKDPFSVFVDLNLESWTDVQQITDVTWVNRWDYIAKYPELEDEILKLPTKDQFDDISWWNFPMDSLECDLIGLKEFYHMRSPALPNGRFMQFLGPDIVLYDGPIPYKRLPFFRMVPGKWWGSTEGYSESRDLLNLTQAQNTLWSTIFTNQSTFGVQNILVPEGCNISPMQIAQGLRRLSFNPAAGKPEPLQLTATPKEIFDFAQMISTKMETIFGLNSVTRGVSDDLSGKAMGLLQSMSIQYASAFQSSYAETAEDLGSFILQLIKDFAKTERMASVVGKFNRGEMIKFTGEDISQVERVVVNLQNPYLSTLAGKKEVADTLLNAGVPIDAQQYLTFLETGVFEVMTQFEESKMSMIRQENEHLMDGRGDLVKAVAGEPHLLHAREHLAMLSKPEIKMNSSLAAEVYRHVQEHIDLYRTQDPIMAELSKEPPYVAPPPMPVEPVPGMEPGPEQGMPSPIEQMTPPPAPGPEEALQQSLK